MKRMYILILDDVDTGHAVNSACHAAVACTLKYRDTAEVSEWLETSFRKVTCRVSRKEFDLAIEKESDFIIMTELNLDGRETCVAFKPREDYHKCFKFFKLFK